MYNIQDKTIIKLFQEYINCKNIISDSEIKIALRLDESSKILKKDMIVSGVYESNNLYSFDISVCCKVIHYPGRIINQKMTWFIHNIEKDNHSLKSFIREKTIESIL